MEENIALHKSFITILNNTIMWKFSVGSFTHF